jgi:hypothetical protein
MTLAVQTVRVLYNGNGSTTAFSIPFSFDDNDEVEAILVSSADVETVQTYTTHYTISGSTLTMVTAPATGQKLLIRYDPSLDQELDLSDQSANLPSTIEAELDDIVGQIQMLYELFKRCIQLPKSSSHTFVEIPRTLVAGSVLQVNDDGDGFEFIDEEDLFGMTIDGTEIQELLTGDVDGSNLTFTASRTPLNSRGFKLYRSGILLIEGTHYSRAGVTVTMVVAPRSPQYIHANYWYQS